MTTVYPPYWHKPVHATTAAEAGTLLSDRVLAVLARAAIFKGRIPGTAPMRMWGGAGNGSACAVCSRAVRPDHSGMELQFEEAGRSSSFLHARCYNAWREECERLAGTPGTETGTASHTPTAGEGIISGREHDGSTG
jgi:hypothetical protein